MIFPDSFPAAELFYKIGTGIVLAGKEVFYSNPVARQILGYDPAGKSLTEFLSGDLELLFPRPDGPRKLRVEMISGNSWVSAEHERSGDFSVIVLTPHPEIHENLSTLTDDTGEVIDSIRSSLSLINLLSGKLAKLYPGELAEIDKLVRSSCRISKDTNALETMLESFSRNRSMEESVDISLLMQVICQEAAPLLESSGIRLRYTPPKTGAMYISANAADIIRLFYNLIAISIHIPSSFGSRDDEIVVTPELLATDSGYYVYFFTNAPINQTELSFMFDISGRSRHGLPKDFYISLNMVKRILKKYDARLICGYRDSDNCGIMAVFPRSPESDESVLLAPPEFSPYRSYLSSGHIELSGVLPPHLYHAQEE